MVVSALSIHKFQDFSAFFQDLRKSLPHSARRPQHAGLQLKGNEMRKFFNGLTALVMLFTVIPLSAAKADDMSDAKAASAAFYGALAILDDGTAMSKVFAQTPYITFVGPRTKDVIVGWPALKGYFVKSNALFKSRETRLASSTMHVSGTLAWEVGLEVGENEMADGKKVPVDWVATNVFEKQADGKWLMVSHHVQPGAK
jgi:ketosteroid isomerase-like protein